jgi:hypothetical protein
MMQTEVCRRNDVSIRRLVFAFVLVIPFILSGATGFSAQQLTGGISGTLTDASAAVVPEATVTVVNTGTNLKVTVTTAPDGSYQIPALPVGTYTVSFTKTAFKTEFHSSILVEANRTTTVDGKLEVGGVTTTVQVTATPLLNKTDTATAYTLSEQAITDSPLGTGSFTQLAILAPGVSADFLNTSGTNAGLGNQAIWANGQRSTSNSFSVNGLNANNLFNGGSTSQVASNRFTANTGGFIASNTGSAEYQTNTSVYNTVGQGMPTPAPETLQELRVTTAMYDASEGGKSGAQIAAVTRSGTNSYHGELYDHFQNDAMNAASFFRNASPLVSNHDKVPKLRYNRFGATFGGPILKDRLFFFGAYTGIRDSDGLSGTKTVNVPLHLTDDRSAAALVNVASVDFSKTITASQIDPAALNLLNFKIGSRYLIPSAQITDATTANALGYDVFFQSPSTFSVNQYVGNVDYNFGSRDRLSGKYFYQYNPTASAFADSGTLGFPSTMHDGAQTFALSNTTILSPRLTSMQKVGYVRSAVYKFIGQPTSPLDLGINIFNSSVFPSISITNAFGPTNKSYTIGSSFGNSNAGMFQNQYTYSTNVNWIQGRHTIQAGINWDHSQLNIINRMNQAANINFQTFTDLLAGNVQTSSKDIIGASNRYLRAEIVGAFVTDNIRLMSNLNLNLGLRYDYNGPFTEKYGKLTSFHPDAYQYDSVNDVILSTGLVVAGNNPTLGTKGVSDSTLTGRQWGFGPRIGIVWSPSKLKNVVVRTGFGMFYDRGEYFTALSPGSGPNGTGGPFGITLAQPFTQSVSATSSGTLSNPFLNAPIPAPVTNQSLFVGLLPNAAQIRNCPNPVCGAGATTYVFGGYDPANKLPYTENWSFDLQWQPFNTVQMTLGYTGSHSVHQMMQIPFNQAGIATATHQINGETTSYGFNVPGVTTETLKTFGSGNVSLRVPYLGYDSNSVFYKAEGVANYNALQFSIRKRLSHGVQVVGSYTWSHTLDEQSGMGLFFNGNDPLNPRSSYGTSTYDRPHVASVQYFYQVPKWVSSDRSVLGQAANGWGLSGIVVFQSGFPFNIYDFSGAVAGEVYGRFVNVVDPVLPLKQNVTAKQAQLQGTTGIDVSKPYLDPAAFYVPVIQPGNNGVPACVTAANGTQSCDTFETSFGSTGRNTFRAPFQNRFDLSAQKRFQLTEKVSLKYQADLLNVFNHPVFDAPSAGGTTPTQASFYSVTGSGASPVVPTFKGPASSFGMINRTIGSPRFIQMSLHVIF